jgi:tetratricopeptide (TPR) repeat protein
VARAAPREDRAQARALLVKGKQLLQEKRYRSAVRCFQKAYRFWKRREIQFNLALAYLELGDKVASGRHLRRYLDQATPAEREALPARFQRLQQQIGVLRVQSTDPLVEIWIDGQRRGTGSVVVVVLPGSRAVELRRGPRVLVHKVIEVAGGREVIWNPPPVPALRPHRRVPPPLSERIKRPGRQQLHWAFFAAAASLAVGAGAAVVYTGVRTLQLREEWRTNYTAEIKQKFERHELATNVLITIAATAAVGAGILAFFTRWRSSKGEKRRSMLLPTIVPGGAGLSFYHCY